MNIEHIKPYATGESKRVQIERVFDTIAHRYDRLNRLMSFGIDMLWRRRALRLLHPDSPTRAVLREAGRLHARRRAVPSRRHQRGRVQQTAVRREVIAP